MKVLFTSRAWAQYLHWVETDPDTLARLNTLIEQARRDPFRGLGKPEPLKNEFKGWWSRRINQGHRLVYRVSGSPPDQQLEIVQCRFHY
ncbi:Txe/YoeB family addiction module toxin [Brevundimonas sp. VNH65]|uniref:Txe/YoeB family addiction module toxin n=1 Tax=Brevundimonas sp. VNH65 TaxID=3400917 RepID=UPI003C048E2D